MKTHEQLEHARQAVARTLLIPGLNDTQKAMLCGMSSALCWADDAANGSTLDRLLAGEPIAPGKDPSRAMRNLKKGLEGFQ